MKLKGIGVFLVMAFFISGCGSKVFNPYDEEFMCPDIGYGKCATMDQAYNESYEATVENEMVLTPQTNTEIEEDMDGEPANTEPDPEYIYRNRLFSEMASIIEDSETPLLAPPKIARVLVLNYSDEEDTFFSSRHIYFITTQSKWVLSPYEGLE